MDCKSNRFTDIMATEVFVRSHLFGISYNQAWEEDYITEKVFPNLLSYIDAKQKQLKNGDIIRLTPEDPLQGLHGKLFFDGKNLFQADFSIDEMGAIPKQIVVGGKDNIQPNHWVSVVQTDSLINLDQRLLGVIYHKLSFDNKVKSSKQNTWNCEIYIGKEKWRIIYIPPHTPRSLPGFICDLFRFKELVTFFLSPEAAKEDLWTYSEYLYVTKA